MARKFLSFILLISLAGCIVKKQTTYSKDRKVSVEATPEAPAVETVEPAPAEEIIPVKADLIITTALTYSGVRYQFGGTSRKGMDCSGLLYVAFGEHNVSLPRTSFQMAERGKRIKIKHVAKGDLLFFKTSRRGKRINHVGLVVSVENDNIKFIHATSSRGVIVSSLREGFWNYAFVKATRVL